MARRECPKCGASLRDSQKGPNSTGSDGRRWRCYECGWGAPASGRASATRSTHGRVRVDPGASCAKSTAASVASDPLFRVLMGDADGEPLVQPEYHRPNSMAWDRDWIVERQMLEDDADAE